MKFRLAYPLSGKEKESKDEPHGQPTCQGVALAKTDRADALPILPCGAIKLIRLRSMKIRKKQVCRLKFGRETV